MKRFDHPVRNTRHATRPRSDQRGVALVITLLMLVIITVMAVAFLLLSQRETASVGALHSTTDAELAADAAVEQSKALILQPFLGANGGLEVMGRDLTVSAFDTNAPTANRLNPGNLQGFVAPPVFVNTNRSGVWDPNVPLDDRFYLDLNENGRFEETGVVPDFDRNNQRLGDVEVVGDPQWFGLLLDPSRPHASDNRYIARYSYLIQPIGRSLDVNWIHNDVKIGSPVGASSYSRNQGVGSFEINHAAFLVDLNVNEWGAYLFNPGDALGTPNTGVAFQDALRFLDYRYAGNKLNLFKPATIFPMGVADFNSDHIDNFGNGPRVTLGASLQNVTSSESQPEWEDAINAPNQSWPGAGSPRSFFSIRDFLDRTKLPSFGPLPQPPSFVDRMSNAVHHPTSTYDRYTYYRMLAQLGTDGAAAGESDRKINLNYKNTTNLLVDFMGPEGWRLIDDTAPAPKASQFTNWTAFEFFNRAADALLTNEFYPRGNTNIGLVWPRTIPVYTNRSAINTNGVTGVAGETLYSPRIHQLLQLAANLYEGTVSNKAIGDTNYPHRPSVYRPVFKGVPGANGVDIHVVGYADETEYTGLPANQRFRNRYFNGGFRWLEFQEVGSAFNAVPFTFPSLMLYDVPMIFGARQGFPSLNEVAMHTAVQVQRRLMLEKNSSGTISAVRRAFSIGVSNVFFTEIWNPYTNYSQYYGPAQAAFPRQLTVVATNYARTWLTNGYSSADAYTNSTPVGSGYVIAPNVWRTNEIVLLGANQPRPAPVDSAVRLNGGNLQFVPDTNNVVLYDTSGIPMTNRWGLIVSNRVVYLLFDEEALVDAFYSARLTDYFDISAALTNPSDEVNENAPNEYKQIWSINSANFSSPSFTNFSPNLLFSAGEVNQIKIAAADGVPLNDVYWSDYGQLAAQGLGTVAEAVAGFRTWLTNTADLTMKMVPYSTGAKRVKASGWQVNDPFVHSTIQDLTILDPSGNPNVTTAPRSFSFTSGNPAATPYTIFYQFGDFISISNANKHYFPWSLGQGGAADADRNFNYMEKDSGIVNPNLWEFPSHKYPNPGWIGRLHRGTPWQTISLKSPSAGYDHLAWREHVGAAARIETMPTNDWRLVDIFTTDIHPNVARGRLSINQTNLAAWSAVFSGINTSSNLYDNSGNLVSVDRVMEPDGVEQMSNPGVPSPLRKIVDGINATRQTLPNNQFRRLSEFLAVPQLTVAAPDLEAAEEGVRRGGNSLLRDSDYERLAEQILGLVKVGEPRFVVYAWGQSLKPAERGVEVRNTPVPGVYPAGSSVDPGTRLVKNYQITGETAMRAVVKVEFTYKYDPSNNQVIVDANGVPIRHPRAVVESFNIIPTD